MENLTGKSGLGKKTPLQLMFQYYYLQEEYETETFRKMWEHCNNSTYSTKLVQPVLTQWEYVGQAAACFLKR